MQQRKTHVLLYLFSGAITRDSCIRNSHTIYSVSSYLYLLHDILLEWKNSSYLFTILTSTFSLCSASIRSFWNFLCSSWVVAIELCPRCVTSFRKLLSSSCGLFWSSISNRVVFDTNNTRRRSYSSCDGVTRGNPGKFLPISRLIHELVHNLYFIVER